MLLGALPKLLAQLVVPITYSSGSIMVAVLWMKGHTVVSCPRHTRPATSIVGSLA